MAPLTKPEVILLGSILDSGPTHSWAPHVDRQGSIAYEIHDYVGLRAGQGAGMPVSFFAACIARCIPAPFGVYYSTEGIFGDAHEPYPGFLAAFLTHRGGNCLRVRQRLVCGRSPVCFSVPSRCPPPSSPTRRQQTPPCADRVRHGPAPDRKAVARIAQELCPPLRDIEGLLTDLYVVGT